MVEKLPKTSGAFRGNYCQTCGNITQINIWEEFFNRQMLFRNVCKQILMIKRNIWRSCSRLSVCFVWNYNTYISLGIVKDSSDCFWQSSLFFLYCKYRKQLKLELLKTIDQSIQSEIPTPNMFFFWVLLNPQTIDQTTNGHLRTNPPTIDPTTRWINNHTGKSWQ